MIQNVHILDMLVKTRYTIMYILVHLYCTDCMVVNFECDGDEGDDDDDDDLTVDVGRRRSSASSTQRDHSY